MTRNPFSEPEILDFYRAKRILVTGGGGYLGSSFLSALAGTDCEIIRLSRPADIRSLAEWERALRDVEMIFHFAGQTSARFAEQNPSEDYEINVRPVLHLLRAARKRSIAPVSILFAGTVTQAGIPRYLPVDEKHPDFPITVYDRHKCEAENYLKAAVAAGEVKAAALRLSNVYGPSPQAEGRRDRGILNQMVFKALAGEDLTLLGEGGFMRDYLFIEDVVRAFLRAGAFLDRINGRHFVIGSGEGHTLRQAFEEVRALASLKTGRKIRVECLPESGELLEIDKRNFVADSTAFSENTGWKSRYGLREGLERMMDASLCVS